MSEMTAAIRDGQQLLVTSPARAIAARIDPELWLAWLADPDTRRRYEALVYRRGPGQCAYWLGAISSTGHAKFRAGSRARARPDAGSSRIVTAHVYAPAALRRAPGGVGRTGRDPAPMRRGVMPELGTPDHRHPA